MQKKLLVIHDFCVRNPNAGALKLLLSEFISNLEGRNSRKRLERENTTVLVAILLYIGSISPSVFPAVATSVSMIMWQTTQSSREKLFSLILKKTARIPNNGYLEIWLQRIAIANKLEFSANDKMCGLVNGGRESIWNFDWLNDNTQRDRFKNYSVVDATVTKKLKPFIERSEFDAFWKGYD